MTRNLYLSLIILVLIVGCNNKQTASNKIDDKQSVGKMLSEADSLFNNDNYKKALIIYTKIIEKDSTIGSVFFNRAYSAGSLYNYDISIHDYHLSIKNGYRVYDSYFNIGCDFMSLGNPRIALSYFKRALELDSTSKQAKELIEICKKEIGEER